MADNKPENYDGRESEEPQVWSMEPFRRNRKKTYVHNPCGHWHLPVLGQPAGCLEYVAHEPVYPVYNFYPKSAIMGTDRRIYCIMGANSIMGKTPAKAYIYDRDLNVVLQKDYEVADNLDLVLSTRERGGYIWVLAKKASSPQWLFQIDMDDLSIVSQRCPGDCVVGTDGNNYYMSGLAYGNNSAYGPVYRPTTGQYWESSWTAIPAGYAYHVYADYTTPESYWGCNSLVDFLVDDTYFYTNSGAYPRNITKRDYNMQRIATTTESVVGVGEMCFSPDESLIAFTGCSLYATGYSKILIYRASDLTKKVGETISTDGFYSSSDSQNCLLWHENGCLYHTQGRHEINGTAHGRVIKMDDGGNILATYENYSDKGAIANSRITASAKNIYWWQDGYGEEKQNGIIKLDLDLNFVCFEPFHFKEEDIKTNGFFEYGFSWEPLLIDKPSHMIFSAYTKDAPYFVKWNYYA